MVVIGLFGFMLPTPSAHAATGINKQINYQARLLNSAGATVPDGTYNLEFKIYQDGNGCVGGGSSPCSGTLKWTEDWLNNNSQGVTVTNGYFSVMLGAGSDSAALATAVDFNQSALWLSINIGNTNTSCATFSACSGDGEMLPFTQFAAAPYALNAAAVGGVAASNLAQLSAGQTFTGANVLQPTTNVTGVVVKQTSASSPTADIFNVQTANGSNIIQATGPSSNNSAVTIQSVGGSNALTLTGAGAVTISGGAASTWDIGNNTLSLQTTNNGAITTGTGTVTTGGKLVVQGAGNALSLSSAPSASATQSLINLGSAISGGSTSGTFIGVNAASGFAGDLINLQVNSVSQLIVTAGGTIKQGGGTLTYNAGAPTNYTGASTITANDIVIERYVTTTQASAMNLTLPSAASIVATIPRAAVGDIFTWVLSNSGTGKVTLVGAGGTGVASGAVGTTASTTSTFICRLTNVTSGSEAVTCY